MEFLNNSKNYSLNRKTYTNLRWIAIIGQLVAINVAAFIFKFDFPFIKANIIVLIGAVSNIYLLSFYVKNLLSNRTAFNFLIIDILQLTFLLYITGGILNPFIFFLIIPSVFASLSLEKKTNYILILVTLISIILLTFFHQETNLPFPKKFLISEYFYYSIPVSLIIALFFLNYFAITFGEEASLRKDALNKIQQLIAKEHELVSLGGQAAAAAHSLATPLSTIKVITQELSKSLKGNQDIESDMILLTEQVERCNQILKKLTLNPDIEDEFIDYELTLSNYINEIIKSFKSISKKKFFFQNSQDTNPIKFKRSIEIIYGLRNFIGNANKFAKEKIFLTINSDSQITELIIEDDGDGFPKDILDKIGEPYIRTKEKNSGTKSGLGLGIFIGGTLLERNYAKVICRNSITRNGAEVIIRWSNKDLINF
ncbi:ActS/PrrB/RegB family redox-sensitive histidine kinase [Candidatus Pelagibacter sp.]|nr:ActS/PrrB/RegB family redox-sensitive histidine kinase [Candidatus Pelagibacter sp.]